MSNINGYLDFEGLKKYHELAGYSEIPITNYTTGSLDSKTGNVVSNGRKRVTDYIELPIYRKYTAVVDGNGIICYYDRSDEFIGAETFTGSISFTLKDKTKLIVSDMVEATLRATKIRISCDLYADVEDTEHNPFVIRSLHNSTTQWLYDKISDNSTDISSIQGDVTNIQGNITSIQSNIETNSTDINNVKNMVYKAHCSHSINISPTIVEIGASTPVYVTKLNFLFNNVAQSAADRVTSAKVYNTSNVEITGINASNINTSITEKDENTLLGTPNSTITVNPGYEIVYNGNTFRGSYTISAVHPTYYGGGVKELITGGSDASMTKSDLKSKFGSSALKTSASGSYKITLNSKNYIFIVSPYTISTDKVYNESTGFQFPMDSLGTLTVIDIGAGAPNATYYVYRSSYEQDPGTYNMQIKS